MNQDQDFLDVLCACSLKKAEVFDILSDMSSLAQAAAVV